ncbi:MAG: hypothetical protein KC589_07845 [Nanoarchaeota archaeon]|nr:hypothetical protein [Nanoarchaeota archaeon]
MEKDILEKIVERLDVLERTINSQQTVISQIGSDFINFKLSINTRQEIKEWLEDSKAYGFIEGNPMLSRASRLFKDILEEK